MKAIAESTGRKPKEVTADLKKEGDLGLVAMVSSAPTIPDYLLTSSFAELEELPTSVIQTEAVDRSVRLLEAGGNCQNSWELGERRLDTYTHCH